MANEHSGHRDRLRERYLSEGLDSFAPHNVLELLLFYSVPRRDTNVLAHRLIEQFGSLVGVLNAGPEQLAQVEGIGMNAAVHLHLVADIARRYYAEAIAPPPNDARREDLMRYYGQRLVAACNGLPEETLYLVCLDNNLREIRTASPPAPPMPCSCPAAASPRSPCATMHPASCWRTIIRAASPSPPGRTSPPPYRCGTPCVPSRSS